MDGVELRLTRDCSLSVSYYTLCRWTWFGWCDECGLLVAWFCGVCLEYRHTN